MFRLRWGSERRFLLLLQAIHGSWCRVSFGPLTGYNLCMTYAVFLKLLTTLCWLGQATNKLRLGHEVSKMSLVKVHWRQSRCCCCHAVDRRCQTTAWSPINHFVPGVGSQLIQHRAAQTDATVAGPFTADCSNKISISGGIRR